jgi:hypothetical protein
MVVAMTDQLRVRQTCGQLLNFKKRERERETLTRQLLNFKKRERERETLTLAQQQARPPKVGGYRRGSL